MTAITGANAKIALKKAGTFGTAATVGAGDLLNGYTLEVNENAEALEVSPIGSGDGMINQSDRGAVSPTVNLSGRARFRAPEIHALKNIFGDASAANSYGGSLYAHSILYNETANESFMTLAFQPFSANVAEAPSVAFRSVTINYPEPPDYVTFDFEGLANEILFSGTGNSNSDVEAATEGYPDPIVWEFSDDFQLNAQAGGALSGSDRINIQSATVTINRPQEHAREAKGSSGNGQPVAQGAFIFDATLTITTRTLADATLLEAHQDGTEYKAKLSKTAGGSAGNLQFHTYFPRLKLVESPSVSIQDSGNNPQTYTFRAMVASSVPTGMASRFPHIVVINTDGSNL